MEWPKAVNVQMIGEIHAVKAAIENEFACKDIIVGYHSLLLHFKEPYRYFDEVVQQLKAVVSNMTSFTSSGAALWKIPVCYDPEFGIDMLEMSRHTGLTPEEVIALHTSSVYTVFFIGFLPGFLYLGGLDKQLFMPRKPSPRLHVAKGSVAIGGRQTGVYPIATSGGWNIIGKTPVSFFDVHKPSPCFAKPLDKVQFVSVSRQEHLSIEKELASGDYTLLKSDADD